MLKNKLISSMVVVLFSLVCASCTVEPVYRGPYVQPTYVAPSPNWTWRAHPYEGWGWYHPNHGWHRRWR